MRLPVIVLALLVLLMVAGVLPSPGGMQSVVFRTPVFLSLLGLLAAALLWCSLGRGLSWRRLPLRLLHVGVVVLLLGALVEFLAGVKTVVRLPLIAEHVVREFRIGPDKFVSPGFGVSVTDFRVAYYDPDYQLCKSSASSNGAGHVVLQTVRPGRDGAYDFGEAAGKVRATELKDPASGKWVEERVLGNGLTLRMSPPVARSYAAVLRFTGKDGRIRDESLAVNHPVDYEGWRFGLESYDPAALRYIVVAAKWAPGWSLVRAGIWMVIVGTAVVGFGRRDRNDDSP